MLLGRIFVADVLRHLQELWFVLGVWIWGPGKICDLFIATFEHRFWAVVTYHHLPSASGFSSKVQLFHIISGATFWTNSGGSCGGEEENFHHQNGMGFVMLMGITMVTPRKINMEPENAPLEEENHPANHHFQVLWGCTLILKKHLIWVIWVHYHMGNITRSFWRGFPNRAIINQPGSFQTGPWCTQSTTPIKLNSQILFSLQKKHFMGPMTKFILL